MPNEKEHKTSTRINFTVRIALLVIFCIIQASDIIGLVFLDFDPLDLVLHVLVHLLNMVASMITGVDKEFPLCHQILVKLLQEQIRQAFEEN